MWLDESTTPQANEILINRLGTCLRILEEYESKTSSISHTFFVEQFKEIATRLLSDLEENETFDKNNFKSLIRLSKDGIDQFSGRFKHRAFAKLCQQLQEALTKIVTIQHEDFVAPAQTINKSDIQWHTVNRICFRGDSQPPPVIFKNGFNPRGNDSLAITTPFESTDSVVAFTSRFTAATLFPLDEEVDTTWVYLFYAKKGFDAHKHGYIALVEEGLTRDKVGLFVHEIITDQIEPSSIIGAVKIIRYGYDSFLDKLPAFLNQDLSSESEEFIASFLKKRGKYIMHEYVRNPACTLSSETKELAEWYIKKEKSLNSSSPSAQSSPNPESGFKKQTFQQQEGENDIKKEGGLKP